MAFAPGRYRFRAITGDGRIVSHVETVKKGEKTSIVFDFTETALLDWRTLAVDFNGIAQSARVYFFANRPIFQQLSSLTHLLDRSRSRQQFGSDTLPRLRGHVGATTTSEGTVTLPPAFVSTWHVYIPGRGFYTGRTDDRGERMIIEKPAPYCELVGLVEGVPAEILESGKGRVAIREISAMRTVTKISSADTLFPVDSLGRFRVRSLPPGTYELGWHGVVRSNGLIKMQVAPRERVTLTAGERRELNLAFQKR